MRHKASNIFLGAFTIVSICSSLLSPVIYIGLIIGLGIWSALLHLESKE